MVVLRDMAIHSRSARRLRSVELGFELAHGGDDTGRLTAESADDFDRRAKLVQGLDLEDVDVLDRSDALVGVLVEQGVEHGPGLLAVLGEVVLLPDLVGSLLASQRRLIVGDMADRSNGSRSLPTSSASGSKKTPLFQLLDDRLLAVGLIPAGQELVEGGELRRTVFLV